MCAKSVDYTSSNLLKWPNNSYSRMNSRYNVLKSLFYANFLLHTIFFRVVNRITKEKFSFDDSGSVTLLLSIRQNFSKSTCKTHPNKVFCNKGSPEQSLIASTLNKS